MKRILFFAFVVVLAFASCKSTKRAAQSSTIDTAPRVFTVPSTSEPAVYTPAATATTPSESSVSMRREQIVFTQQEDIAGHGSNSFFVIVGSFSQLENARSFRETLLREGFSPIILQSESGNYRVCINSYRSELEARSRVAQVRQAYPKYSDIWLLIRY